MKTISIPGSWALSLLLALNNAFAAPDISISNGDRYLLEQLEDGSQIPQWRTLWSGYTPPEKSCLRFESFDAALTPLQAEAIQISDLPHLYLFPLSVQRPCMPVQDLPKRGIFAAWQAQLFAKRLPQVSTVSSWPQSESAWAWAELELQALSRALSSPPEDSAHWMGLWHHYRQERYKVISSTQQQAEETLESAEGLKHAYQTQLKNQALVRGHPKIKSLEFMQIYESKTPLSLNQYLTAPLMGYPDFKNRLPWTGWALIQMLQRSQNWATPALNISERARAAFPPQQAAPAQSFSQKKRDIQARFQGFKGIASRSAFFAQAGDILSFQLQTPYFDLTPDVLIPLEQGGLLLAGKSELRVREPHYALAFQGAMLIEKYPGGYHVHLKQPAPEKVSKEMRSYENLIWTSKGLYFKANRVRMHRVGKQVLIYP